MFDLSDRDLDKRILGIGDGPAAFNCELSKKGGSVVSADPLYHYSVAEIERRINESFEEVIRQTHENEGQFTWRHIESVEELRRIRMAAMDEFLSDYTAGLKEGRYLAASLPELPFGERDFELAVCSHLLFLYSSHLSLGFHLKSIEELCRVAFEVRIFPLLELGGEKSRHLETVIKRLQGKAYDVCIETVEYEFQKGGNQMLRVKAY